MSGSAPRIMLYYVLTYLPIDNVAVVVAYTNMTKNV